MYKVLLDDLKIFSIELSVQHDNTCNCEKCKGNSAQCSVTGL